MIAVLLTLLAGFIEVVLGLRFVLLFLGADPLSPFVTWVYSWSSPFAAPFGGIFGQDGTAGGPGVATQSVLDWTTLIALLAYGLIGSVIIRLFSRSGA